MWPMFSFLWALWRVGPERCEYCAVWPEIPCLLHRPKGDE